jgi:hypothetical protein
VVVEIRELDQIQPIIEPGTSLECDEEASRELQNPCQGVIVAWVAGSLWETYAYGQHEDAKFAWTPVRILSKNPDRVCYTPEKAQQ